MKSVFPSVLRFGTSSLQVQSRVESGLGYPLSLPKYLLPPKLTTVFDLIRVSEDVMLGRGTFRKIPESVWDPVCLEGCPHSRGKGTVVVILCKNDV